MSKMCASFRQLRGEIENPVSLEEIDVLYRLLQGEEAEGFCFVSQPKLTMEEAFSVIYFLQESLGLIPDIYEKCKVCSCLYDSDAEGVVIDEDSKNESGKEFREEDWGNYCGYCAPAHELD